MDDAESFSSVGYYFSVFFVVSSGVLEQNKFVVVVVVDFHLVVTSHSCTIVVRVHHTTHKMRKALEFSDEKNEKKISRRKRDEFSAH